MMREDFRRARRTIPPAVRAARSEAICAHLAAWPPYQRARTVMLYYAVGAEASALPLRTMDGAAEKVFLLPRCLPGNQMEARIVLSLETLAKDRCGIPAPDASGGTLARDAIDLILVPGLAFDRSGNRLGQGGGYYDRYLAGFSGMTCGVAFSAQVTGALPVRAHDVPVRALATEDGIEWFGGNTP